ncbi:MAG: helix-hairpin-helix domain-containing protein, partial [Flavobacteriales bacterium]|nr:helix-hairpin-helix domain-containing protein [Flavobacteriales bacterium]
LQSTVFAESTRPANESGIYAGAEVTISEKMRFSAYYDQFRFPWLRFLNDAPTHGSEYLAQLTYRPSRNNEFYVRYRQRSKARNALGDQYIDYPVVQDRKYFRIHAQYKVSESFRLKSRAEWSFYQLEGEEADHGFMFYQDVIFKKMEWPISLSVRYALFDTDSYDARIYAYENDLLYTWSIPAYYSRGSRFYAMVKWDVWRKVDLWLRYSIWSYNDRETISSGLNEIQGNTKSEVKAQLRVRF